MSKSEIMTEVLHIENPLERDGTIPTRLPLVALRNTVLFPGAIMPITIGREKSKKAIEISYKADRWIGVITQRDMQVEDPGREDLYDVGVVAQILKVINLPDGNQAAMVQGVRRFRLRALEKEDPYLLGSIELLPRSVPPAEDMRLKAMFQLVEEKALQYIQEAPHIPKEATGVMQNLEGPVALFNFVVSELVTDVATKQEILEIDDFIQRTEKLISVLEKELQLLRIKKQIERKTRGDIEKQQRHYFLMQQLKQIQQELGETPLDEEIAKLKEKASKKKWSKEVQEHFERELNKLQRMNPQVAEYSILLNYLELLVSLPWNEYTPDQFDLERVRKILDEDHYGLEKVKERIIEHLAVLKLKGDMKAPILCLVGPPGVGKTSLGRSIARALGRKFVRMSLGGLHDEAEIRGHRRTYIGAMPGRIIQGIRRAGSSNPVFVLDEIDKIGKDFRGDPSSALLEVLDPEQNTHFYDNYLEIEYDLSRVLFIATANTTATIQAPLLDRMEIIEISGYTTEEKIEIARRHLIPKQLKEHGLTASQVRIGKRALRTIITFYTRESGVRELERKIAAIMRYRARQVALNEEYKVSITPEDVRQILGAPVFSPSEYDRTKVPGVAIGLAWTRTGGDILFIEASYSKGKGKLTITGNLGDVMKESAMIALSYLKAHVHMLGLSEDFFDDKDIHLHVPEGAIPKDGPSAGITMLTALASMAINKPVKPYLAMTGEITLRGKVLPVGGIKEKILAAKRAGIKEIILSKENEKHVAEIEPQYIKGLRFIYVDRMEEVLRYALGLPEPAKKSKARTTKKTKSAQSA